MTDPRRPAAPKDPPPALSRAPRNKDLCHRHRRSVPPDHRPQAAPAARADPAAPVMRRSLPAPAGVPGVPGGGRCPWWCRSPL
ncbi:hypothetical protein GCM10010207_35600 [Streptomyces atratus]|nr:hypothetical protein GCM10010207_35600 [Streptomyces atratus]